MYDNHELTFTEKMLSVIVTVSAIILSLTLNLQFSNHISKLICGI